MNTEKKSTASVSVNDLYQALWGSLAFECTYDTLTVAQTAASVQRYWNLFEPFQKEHFVRLLRRAAFHQWAAARDVNVPASSDPAWRREVLRELLGWCESKTNVAATA